MNFINSIIGYPLGWIMWACYQLISNYGVALILFTLITRVLLVPTAIKQQKSTVRLKMIQPKVAELQKKYANNRTKLNEELTALYAKENYNPASGCLPMLIQLPILFGLIDVIYKPLTHILRLPADVIQTAGDLVTKAGQTNGMASQSIQISIIGAVKQDPAAFSQLGADVVEKINALDLSFFGLNLTQTPTLAFNLMIIIPILSGLTSLLISVVSLKVSGMGDDASAAATGKSMMLMMPLLSLWFTFQVPAGVGFYWIVSNILMLAQTLLLNKFYNPAEIAAKFEEEERQRKERERQEKIEAKKLLKETEGNAAAALSQKEINRQKLAAARKRQAEKYGDTYVEVTDEDLK